MTCDKAGAGVQNRTQKTVARELAKQKLIYTNTAIEVGYGVPTSGGIEANKFRSHALFYLLALKSRTFNHLFNRRPKQLTKEVEDAS